MPEAIDITSEFKKQLRDATAAQLLVIQDIITAELLRRLYDGKHN